MVRGSCMMYILCELFHLMCSEVQLYGVPLAHRLQIQGLHDECCITRSCLALRIQPVGLVLVYVL